MELDRNKASYYEQLSDDFAAPLLAESHPRVFKQLQMTWGHEHCREILLGLLSDSRDGVRHGFKQEVAVEIVNLLKTHDKLYPIFEERQSSFVPFSSFQESSFEPRKPKSREVSMNTLIKFCIAVILCSYLIHLLVKG
jgi:hypothetical protein